MDKFKGWALKALELTINVMIILCVVVFTAALYAHSMP